MKARKSKGSANRFLKNTTRNKRRNLKRKANKQYGSGCYWLDGVLFKSDGNPITNINGKNVPELKKPAPESPSDDDYRSERSRRNNWW